jgi:hypothetical protein
MNSTVQKVGRQVKKHRIPLGVAASMLVVAAIGFASGTSYQKSHGTAAPTMPAGVQNTQKRGIGGAGGFARRGGAFGTVTAVSNTSISVNQTRSGITTDYTITSTTTVTNNGTAATVADIKVNDTVLITPSTANPKEAASITVNPTQSSGLGRRGGTLAQ